MLTTSASGVTGPPYFLFPEGVNSTPTSTIDDEDVVLSTKADAYMDQDLFQKWLSVFTDFAHRRNPGRPNLLILDGHNSRLMEDSLASAAVNSIHILCLPSHLTHLLQPNDANYNFVFKSMLRDKIEKFATTSHQLSYGALSFLAWESLKEKRMSASICSSFGKCGVYPFDDSKALSLLEEEKPSEPLSSVAGEVLHFVKEVQREREVLSAKFKELEEKEVVFKGKKRFFSSSYSQVLTTSASIAFIRLDKIWKEVRGLKAKELQQWVLQQPEYTELDLLHPDTKKKLTMEQLKEKIFDDLKKSHTLLDLGVKRWLEKNLVVLPNNEQLLREANSE